MKKYKSLLLSLAAVVLLSSCAGSESADAPQTEETSIETLPPETSPTAAETDPPPETTVPEPIYEPKLCTASIERFAVSDTNKFLSAPIEFEIDEEESTLSLEVTYDNYIDILTLQNAFVDVSVTGGSYTFDEGGLNADGSVDLTKLEYCIVEDTKGIKKKYTVTANRQICELPIINIYLKDGKNISGIDIDDYSAMEVYVDNTGSPEYSGTVVMTGQIKGRGHSTWKWDKKPFRIKLDYSAPMLGLHKNRDWILIANYADKSLIRNTVAYEMGKCLSFDWTPTQIPVDLFVNGEYRGVYAIGERMEVANSRVDIDESTEDADTGFLLEVGGADDDDMVKNVDYFHTDSRNISFATFRAPDNITDEQRQFIMNYVEEADKAIMAGEGYEEYIDVESFCDWIIMHELTRNIDSCFRRSCFITKDKGGKLKMGPIWDFDLAFGNFSVDNHDYQRWVSIGSDDEDAYVWTNWSNYLMNNGKFREQLRSRWFEVRDRLMDTATACIDYYADKLYKSQTENFKVWQIWEIRAGYSSKQCTAANTYELQIQYLKDFLTARAAWIDENI